MILTAEIIWLSVIAPGLLVTTVVLVQAYRDRIGLLRSGRNGALMDLACQHITREWMRLFEHALLAIAVILVIRHPPLVVEVDTRFVLGILVLVGALLSTVSMLELYGRRRVNLKHDIEMADPAQGFHSSPENGDSPSSTEKEKA